MRNLLTAILIITFVSCKTEDSNKKFEHFKDGFIEAYWKIYPERASEAGYHTYDSVLTIPNEAYRKLQLHFSDSILMELAKFDLKKLSPNNKTDYHIIQNRMNATLWQVNEERAFEWNPSVYNVAQDFSIMLSENYDSLDVRLRNFSLRLANVPAYFEAAKKQINKPTIAHTNLAIQQNQGGLSVFTTELEAAINNSNLKDDEKKIIEKRAQDAVAAIEDYIKFLTDFKHEEVRSTRLGAELYTKKFEYGIQSGYSVDEIFQKAINRKKYLHEKMNALADEMWPKYFESLAKPEDSLIKNKMIIDKISLSHAHPDSFQIAIEKQIPELEKFVNEKNLIYLDPSKPLIVRKEPAYMAGVAGASISAPGPYDKEGNTYYNVGSLSGWDKDAAESFLREYNDYMLQILNIHEAIPGHYTQLVYSNQSPSMIKSLFGNGTMIEGWAVYTELMMLENGYGNNTPELWMMYYKWHLRTVCNTILDISVHTKNMSEEEGLKLLTYEAFQETAEAKGKWNRVTLTSVQLCSYFTGFTEIFDLREEMKNKLKDKFDLKAFHEKFLSYGSAPVKFIREMMLVD